MAILDSSELSRAIKTGRAVPAWLLYSYDEYLLSSFTSRLVAALTQEAGEEATVLPGPIPDIGKAIEAAGAISLFGTKRVVLFSHLDPAAVNAADLKPLRTFAPGGKRGAGVYGIAERTRKNMEGRGGAQAARVRKTAAFAVEQCGVVAALEKPNERLRQAVCDALCQRAGRGIRGKCGGNIGGALRHRLIAAACGNRKTGCCFGLCRDIACAGAENVHPQYRGGCVRTFPAHPCRAIGCRLPVAGGAVLPSKRADHDCGGADGSYLDMYRVKAGAAAGVAMARYLKNWGIRAAITG